MSFRTTVRWKSQPEEIASYCWFPLTTIHYRYEIKRRCLTSVFIHDRYHHSRTPSTLLRDNRVLKNKPLENRWDVARTMSCHLVLTQKRLIKKSFMNVFKLELPLTPERNDSTKQAAKWAVPPIARDICELQWQYLSWNIPPELYSPPDNTFETTLWSAINHPTLNPYEANQIWLRSVIEKEQSDRTYGCDCLREGTQMNDYYRVPFRTTGNFKLEQRSWYRVYVVIIRQLSIDVIF